MCLSQAAHIQSSGSRRHNIWITTYSIAVTSALIGQFCLLKLILCKKDKEASLYRYTLVFFHTYTHLLTHTHTESATCLKSPFEHGKGKRCHNLSFLSSYQCPILIHPRVYRFSLPVLSNLSQLPWLWLLPKPQSALCLSQVILYRAGESEMSGES